MAAAIKVRTLFFQMLLTFRARGLRNDDNGDDWGGSLDLDGSVTICDDEDIWIQVSSPTSAEGIRGINWQSIKEKVDDFIENQQVIIDAATPSMKKLQELIASKEGKRAPDDISKEDIENLVLQAVSIKAAFGHRDAAEETRCGKPGHTYEGMKFVTGFENSVEAMVSVSESFFTSEIKATRDTFTTICEDFLGFQRTGNAKDDDLASYCDELCSEMARVAQDVSDARATAGKSDLVKLKKQLAKLELDKRTQEMSQDECRKEWNRLEQFKKYMEQLQTDIKVKHKVVMSAESALYEASQIMEETVAKLDAQQSKVEKVVEGLTPLAEAATEAKARFDVTQTWENSLKDQLKSAQDEMARLENDLEKIRQADTFASNIKQRLSVLLMKIDSHHEEAFREPLRRIGITEDYDAYAGAAGFARDVMSTESFESMTTGLAQLHGTCQKALESFKSLKLNVDLTPLCVLPQQDEAVQQLGSAVQARSDKVVESLMNIQTWLSPYKGNKEHTFTHELEATDYVGVGEPLGLRRMLGVQVDGRFYKNYLVHWKRYGKFLKLLASLGDVISDLDNKIQEAEEKIDNLMDELFQAEQQLTEAVSYLESTEFAAKVEKDTAEDEITSLQAAMNDAQNSLEDLKLKFQEAIDQWREAKHLLISSHAKHTRGESLLEQKPGFAAISPHAQGQL